MKSANTCEHMNFNILTKVARISKEEGGPITHFAADITINCAECGEKFQFLGPKMGYSPYEVRTNFDGTELRAPIKPLNGPGPPDGLPSFLISDTSHGEAH